ncbi:General transcription factor 3C polypeptide, putative [Pediculus humanus corporis]|uniref:General transcription factor 3C polypeptide, putative n=1 Tax=Pediculus humanus subsp. corporis TaxID=121224 RepID=E0W2H4_PEDHC|nr:General transcription factor 3C polypeptide, putative [Pediculus humanus corporis]EEB19830.1 General transcription factor 3C polypeptide, putative [Pediculus humanus corporis]
MDNAKEKHKNPVESLFTKSVEDFVMSEDDSASENENDSSDIEEGEADETFKEKASKFLDGNISFNEYKAVVESNAEDNVNEVFKKKYEIQEKVKRVRKSLPPALEGLMGQANMCFVKGDHESALQMCLEIIRQVPSAPEPFQTLAEIYEEKGLKEKSLQVAMIAAHLNPRDCEQWINLGERSLQLNNLSDAITCYSRAIKYDPGNINPHIIRCQLLEQKGDRKSAIKSYHKLVDSVKAEFGSLILEYAKIAARYYHEENDIPKAKEVMETAFLKVPNSVSSEDVNLYVELLMMVRDYMKALEIIAKYCDVKIEGEEDIVADDETNQIACSSFRVLSCDIPTEIPVQIHVKLIVILIHLKSCHLLDNLLAPFLELENVEQSGDLYIDVVEALMSEGMHIEALKLLKLLTESKNYSLPAVWLNYAECLKHLGRLEEAVSAYLMVMQQAPKHVEARLMVSQLLNELGRSDEAISVLTQDPEAGSLDTGLLYERCLLLNGYSERTDEFLAVGRLLLSRHCVKITKKDDLMLLSKLKGYAKKQEAMKRSNDAVKVEGPELVEGKRLPTSDEEWTIFLSLCKTAYETKQFALLQRLTFSALGSPVLNSNEKKESDVFFLALLSCFYNKDSFHGYNFSRDIILNNGSTKAWNLFNLMLLDAEDSRHYRFIMRQLSRKPTHPALIMLYANNCFVSGTYKYSLSEYMSVYRQDPSGILAFMISLTLLQMSCQKFTEKKNLLITQCIAFLWQYKEQRGEYNSQEIHYNMGRLFHQLGLYPAALFHYKKALNTVSKVAENHGAKFDLKREIAFNISLIYQNSGSLELARHYIEKYIVI